MIIKVNVTPETCVAECHFIIITNIEWWRDENSPGGDTAKDGRRNWRATSQRSSEMRRQNGDRLNVHIKFIACIRWHTSNEIGRRSVAGRPRVPAKFPLRMRARGAASRLFRRMHSADTFFVLRLASPSPSPASRGNSLSPAGGPPCRSGDDAQFHFTVIDERLCSFFNQKKVKEREG